MRVASALFLSVALATPAFSQCLTSADLARGVVVGFQGGDRTVMRMSGDGTLMIDEIYSNGDPTMRYRAWRGIYFLEEFEVGANGQAAPGTRLVIEFPVAADRLPEPLAGVTYSTQTTNVFDDGFRRPETTTISFSQGSPLNLSGCNYETISASLRYDWGQDGGLTLQYVYLPAVQTAILLSNQFDGDVMASATPVTLSIDSGTSQTPTPTPVPSK